MYPLARFLAKHTQAAVKVEGTKEWRRATNMIDPAVEEYEAGEGEILDKVGASVKEDSSKDILNVSEGHDMEQ